ncbi:hypothetical protein KEM54_000928 [Ascosphaera aggregata]|nr:hypothetical protein KEM54_000928 [Ascosphaera aggregata]
MSDPSHDELIAQLVDIAHIQPSEARHFLECSNWDVTTALGLVYENNAPQQITTGVEVDDDEEKEVDDDDDHNHNHNDAAQSSHPSTSATPASAAARQPTTKLSATAGRKFATLKDVKQEEESKNIDSPYYRSRSHGGAGGSGAGGGAAGSRDDRRDHMPQDMFAGGEKSGLAVHNPDDLKRKIIEKAHEPLASRPKTPPATNFIGPARTLGGDDVPSREVEPTTPATREHVRRFLHFWSNGFSIDDGELYDTANPAYAEILNHIRHGRAPLAIMNVTRDQEVDVEIVQHTEAYKPAPKKWKPFSGAGHRLGSHTPVIVSSSSSSSSRPTSPNTAAATAATVAAESPGSTAAGNSAAPTIDESKPVVTLQVRLGNGSRIVGRFNTTHTIGDVYAFVAANTSDTGRAWALMTTFPSRELKDKEVPLGDLEGYKRGGVVVQKWT